MKQKLLSLCLALSLFAFGTSVKAEGPTAAPHEKMVPHHEEAKGEHKAAAPGAGGVISSLICNLITQYFPGEQGLPPCCIGICSTTPPMTQLAQCAASLYAITTPQCAAKCTALGAACTAAKSVVSGVGGLCTTKLNPICSTLPLVGCSNTSLRQVCGSVCCNMGTAAGNGITNCLTKNGDNCGNYTTNVKPCFSTSCSAADSEHKKGEW